MRATSSGRLQHQQEHQNDSRDAERWREVELAGLIIAEAKRGVHGPHGSPPRRRKLKSDRAYHLTRAASEGDVDQLAHARCRIDPTPSEIVVDAVLRADS